MTYQDDYGRAYHAERRKEVQDVYGQYSADFDRGPLDKDRRAAAADSFRVFCETYGAADFSLAWSPYHLSAIEKIETAVKTGGMFAFAMPRGSGKTTLCHWAVLWAGLNGWSPYTVLVASKADAAKKRLSNLKSSLRFNQTLREDYPEIVCPVLHLSGEARKAVGQRFKGSPTGIAWTQDQIIFPTLDLPYAKANGAIIDVTGIEGDIRGRNHQKLDGSTIRPRLAIIDDPQTRESAKSLSQCEHRLSILTGDIKYLAGPDQPLGVVVPATIIYQDDMVSRLLDREKHPEYRGELVKMIERFPDAVELWERYADIQAEDFRNGGDGSRATTFYQENREAMDRGAIVSWPERYYPNEVSAIQHAMNHRIRDELSFWAECQNTPIVAAGDEIQIPMADQIADRTNQVPHGVIPREQDTLTAFIDISEPCLWWAVCSFAPGFTGSVIDYGVFPEQGLNYVTLATLRRRLSDIYPAAGLELTLKKALTDLCDTILGREYLTELGDPINVSLCLIDSGWGASTQTVYDFCRRSKYSHILLPSKGVGITAARDPLVDAAKKRKPGESLIGQWKIGGRPRLCQYDSNHNKTFVAHRLLTPVGEPGAFALYEDKPARLRMLAEQLTAETAVRTEGKGRRVDVWNLKPGRDNHFFDAVIGCHVAASIRGITLTGSRHVPSPTDQPPAPKVRKARTL